MKIKVESEKIIKAVKKMDEIEIVLENLEDAKEAIDKDVKVTSYQKYDTTAVDYKMIFLLEFMFDGDVPLEKEVAVLKEFQEFFSKV
jgi:hypothetical protein